jgi:hypothetical protein
MNLMPGGIVSIRHYSVMNHVKSVINSVESENVICVKLSREFASFNFFEGDPIVLGYEYQNEVFGVSAIITSINSKQGIMKINISNISSITNKRFSERFPISIYADAKAKESSKKEIAIAKDISLKGLRMCSKADFTLDEELEVHLYMDKVVIFLTANVIWKMKNPFNIDYGLEIILMDYHNQNLIKQTLKMLKKEQEEFVFTMMNSI